MSKQIGKSANRQLALLQSGRLSVDDAIALNEELERAEAEEAVRAPDTIRRRLIEMQGEDTPPLSHFEELCYKELEGELAPEERHELDEVCQSFSHYANIRASIRQTRLVVPAGIIFPNKERLKRRRQLLSIHLLWKSAAIAACLFLFVVLGGNLFDYQPGSPIKVEYSLASVAPSVKRQANKVVTDNPLPDAKTSQRRPPRTATQIARSTDVLPESSLLPDPSYFSIPSLDVNEEPPQLLPLSTFAVVLVSDRNSELQLALRPSDPAAFHDWESIMFEEEIAQFESEMQELDERLPKPERPFAVKFIDFLITQLAQR